jgi:hypothetical protein
MNADVGLRFFVRNVSHVVSGKSADLVIGEDVGERCNPALEILRSGLLICARRLGPIVNAEQRKHIAVQRVARRLLRVLVVENELPQGWIQPSHCSERSRRLTGLHEAECKVSGLKILVVICEQVRPC